MQSMLASCQKKERPLDNDRYVRHAPISPRVRGLFFFFLENKTRSVGLIVAHADRLIGFLASRTPSGIFMMIRFEVQNSDSDVFLERFVLDIRNRTDFHRSRLVV